MIEWSFEAIERAGISDVIVVVPSEKVREIAAFFGARAHVVAGGTTRQESVRLGLAHVTALQVVVHDAARPFAPPETFTAVIDALEGADAAVPGLQMQDTVKMVREGVVIRTLDREEIWNIQTPQAFHTAALRDAHARAVTERLQGTDDAQLIEHYGGRVVVVEGHPDAFKVTEAADIQRADLVAERSRR